MPPLPQRRNCAYLNRPNYQDCSRWPRLLVRGTATWTGLAINLEGSLDRRFRPDDLCAAYLDGPLLWVRRAIEGKDAGGDPPFSLKRFVRSNG